ncbi:hypothetical protein EV421DRAFT_1914262 [Armillaria borealis]|uniref:Uncharacterized protein n=1 Tax=Armillaria borealis TaxID=47425 RepID=A0AA39ISI5_9AGAR|nr:hypothetical protein EV421DRAFT_1914262 [Armillaria borealis]
MSVLALLLLMLALVSLSSSSEHGDDSKKSAWPPSRSGSPPNWSSNLNPAWSSNWGGNWGSQSNTAPNTSTDAQANTPGTSHQNFPPPMWGAVLNPFYAQHQNAGPPGMFYPHSWGGYTYPAQPPGGYAPATNMGTVRDNRMAIDDEHAHLNDQSGQSNATAEDIPSTNETIAHSTPQLSADNKGKQKASEDELREQEDEEKRYQSSIKQRNVEGETIPLEVLVIARRIHEQDCVEELENQLKKAHESLADALSCTRVLERELEQATRGTKRPHSNPQDDSPAEQPSKHDESALEGYLSDSSKRVIADAERRSSQSQSKKPRRKETGKTKQLTILPRHIEYLAQETAHCTCTMGRKPIHPDEPKLATSSHGSSDDESSDEEEDKPRYLKWHRANPLLKNAPNYKRWERELFLKAEQTKFDKYMENHRLDEYNTALARWESLPGRIPPSLPSAALGFLYIRKYNIVLANTEATGAMRAIDNGRGLQAPIGLEQRPNPRGFPMNIRELAGMVREIQGRHPRWRNDLYLLGEFYRISLSVRLEYRDLTMQTAITRFEDDWVDIREQFKALEPPSFVPMPSACLTSNPRNSEPRRWSRGRSTPSGIGMDTSFQVSIPHTWGYLMSMALSPENDHRGARSTYSRLFTGIVARPQWYTLRIAELSHNEDLEVEVAPSSNVLECMEWDAPGRDMEEDDIIQSSGVQWDYSVYEVYPPIPFMQEFYSDIDLHRRVLLATYGVPPMLDPHQGWWYPDAQDLERIHILRYVQDYEAPDRRLLSTDTTRMTRPVYDWFHVGEHYIYEWLAERPPPSNGDDIIPTSELSNDARPIDEDVHMDNSAAGNVPPVGSVIAPTGDLTRQDGTMSNTAGSLDVGIVHLSIAAISGSSIGFNTPSIPETAATDTAGLSTHPDANEDMLDSK